MSAIFGNKLRLRHTPVILGVCIATLALAGYTAYNVTGIQDTAGSSDVPAQKQGSLKDSSDSSPASSSGQNSPNGDSGTTVVSFDKNTPYDSVEDMALEIKSLREEVQTLQTKLESFEKEPKPDDNNQDDSESSSVSGDKGTDSLGDKNSNQIINDKNNDNSANVSNFGIEIDSFSYEPASSVKITSEMNLIPRTWVNIQLIDALSGENIVEKRVLTKTDGSMLYFLDLPSFLQKGTYKIKAEYYDVVDMEVISIREDNISSNNEDENNESSTSSSADDQSQTDDTSSNDSSDSDLFTAKVDKDSYNPGDNILVTGTTKQSATVNSLLVGPKGYSDTAASQTDSQGKYTMALILPNNANLGEWTVRVMQGDRDRQVTFDVVEES